MEGVEIVTEMVCADGDVVDILGVEVNYHDLRRKIDTYRSTYNKVPKSITFKFKEGARLYDIPIKFCME